MIGPTSADSMYTITLHFADRPGHQDRRDQILAGARPAGGPDHRRPCSQTNHQATRPAIGDDLDTGVLPADDIPEAASQLNQRP